MAKNPAARMIILFFGIFLVSCSHQTLNSANKMAKLPDYTINATVISLFPDLNDECLEKCPGYEFPKDRAILRIDKIISISNPDQVGGEGFVESSEIEVGFLYSSRPAKIIYLQSLSAGNTPPQETSVSSTPSFARPIPIENGYLIYTIETSKPAQLEIVLPGLQQGSKIYAVISLETPSKGFIAQYRVIQ